MSLSKENPNVGVYCALLGWSYLSSQQPTWWCVLHLWLIQCWQHTTAFTIAEQCLQYTFFLNLSISFP